MTVQKMVAGTDGLRLRAGDEHTMVSAISSDSRRIDEGGGFVAVSGQRFDGHDFIDAAIENGAAAVVVDSSFSDPLDEVTVLEAENTRRILGPVGRCFYSHPSGQLRVIGITGTNGKTSSSYLLSSIFASAGWSCGVIGTIEYRWADRRVVAENTTPDGLALQRILRAMVDDGVDVVVIEVSSHGLENGRVKGVDFDAAIFTNLSHDHVDFHGSVDAYRHAKWRLFDTCLPRSQSASGRRPAAVINAGHREGRRLIESMVEPEAVDVISFGLEGRDEAATDTHYRGCQVELELDALSVVVEEPGGGRHRLESGLSGRFNAENMLGAAVTARRFAISWDEIGSGLADVEAIPGRMERVDDDANAPTVFVDYAHSPDALENALTTLRELGPGKLWVVFGCGGDRDRGKRAPMGAVAARLAQRVIVTSDNPRTESPEAIIDEVVEGVEAIIGSGDKPHKTRWWRQSKRREAIEDAILRASPEDVILIAGKGHETTQQCNGHRSEFDDREVARQVLRRRGES